MSSTTITSYVPGAYVAAGDYLSIAATGTVAGDGLNARYATVDNSGLIDGPSGGLGGAGGYANSYEYTEGSGAPGTGDGGRGGSGASYNNGFGTVADGGAGGHGGMGGVAFSGQDSSLTNGGQIIGGVGGVGGQGGSATGVVGYAGAGGAGGTGGSGVSLNGGSLGNYDQISGGAGGAGGAGGSLYLGASGLAGSGGYGGSGGEGGTGVQLFGAGFNNHGTIAGGAGGAGGQGGSAQGGMRGFNGAASPGGAGGRGGTALYDAILDSAATATNWGTLVGGAGGAGGAGGENTSGVAGYTYGFFGGAGGQGGAGGLGLYLAVNTLTNRGQINGGVGGAGGVGGSDPNGYGAAAGGGAGGAGASLFYGGELVNLGEVTGGAGGAGANGYGAGLDGAIGGAGGSGVVVGFMSTLVNQGSISGGAGGSGGLPAPGGTDGATGDAGAGVVIDDGMAVNTASGSISGGVGVDLNQNATLLNYGVIAGTKYSVQLYSSDDRLVAEAGSTLTGTAYGGLGGILELASGTQGTISFAGGGQGATLSGDVSAVVTSFDYLIDAGANWTLAGGGAPNLDVYGTIGGVNGALIKFAGPGQLTLNAGAVVIGGVDGDGGGLALNSIAGGTITGLGVSPVLSGSEITASVYGFGSYDFVAGTWTAAGVSSLSASQTLTDAGAVVITGSFTSAGRIGGAFGAPGGYGESTDVGADGGAGGSGGVGLGAASLSSATFANSGVVFGGGGGFGGPGSNGYLSGGAGGNGGAGGVGLVGMASTITNAGSYASPLGYGYSYPARISGGRGGDGGDAGTVETSRAAVALAGAGGTGGAGIELTGGALVNGAYVGGGSGGTGGIGGADVSFAGHRPSVYGGLGGIGGAGADAVLGVAAQVNNYGTLSGGGGGGGGGGGAGVSPDRSAGAYGGGGGAGGSGCNLTGGSLVNSGTMDGGAGGGGGFGGYAGGPDAISGGGGMGGIGGGGAIFTGVISTNTGVIEAGGGGAGGAPGGVANGIFVQGGYGGAGGAGGVGVALSGGTLTSSGTISGGQGGAGDFGQGAFASNGAAVGGSGGSGGVGGAGATVSVGGSLINQGAVLGGAGGAGGSGSSATALVVALGGNGGSGGAGGAGVHLASGGYLANGGLIAGGGGGAGGGSGFSYATLTHQTTIFGGGAVGNGGDGVDVGGGGVVINQAGGTIAGLCGVNDLGDGYVTVANSGTITGYAYSIHMALPNDLVIAYAGADFIGEMAGGGGTLALSGGIGTVTGLGSNAGTLSGAVSGYFGQFDAYEVVGGGAWTFAGGGDLSPGQTLEIGAASTATVGGGLFDNAGTIVLNGGVLAGYAGVSLVNSGSITGIGSIYGSMNVTNAAGGVIDTDTGPLVIDNQYGGGLYNAGLIEGAAHGNLALKDVTVSGKGSIEAFGTVKLDGATIDGGSVTVKSGGILQVASTISNVGTGVDITNAGSIRITSGAYLYLSSNITGSGSIAIDGVTGTNADLKAVGAVTLSGGGDVSMNVNGFITGYAGSSLTSFDTITGGGAIFGSMTLVNDATIDADAGALLINNQNGGRLANNGLMESTGTGDLSLKDVTVSGSGTITDDHQLKLVDATIDGGTITIGASALLEVVTGPSAIGSGVSLTNDRTLEVAGGALTIAGSITNDGLLETAGVGDLTIVGAIRGTGSARLTGSGNLTIDGAMSGGVIFAGTATGDLVLGASSDFTGTISGLSGTGANAVDLQGVTYDVGDTASFSGTSIGGTLTIYSSDDTVLATLKLKGDYLGSGFSLSDDGPSGTLVTDPPVSHHLTQAIAGFGASSGSAVGQSAATMTVPPLLTTPGHAT